jgi:hypothetical protein
MRNARSRTAAPPAAGVNPAPQDSRLLGRHTVELPASSSSAPKATQSCGAGRPTRRPRPAASRPPAARQPPAHNNTTHTQSTRATPPPTSCARRRVCSVAFRRRLVRPALGGSRACRQRARVAKLATVAGAGAHCARQQCNSSAPPLFLVQSRCVCEGNAKDSSAGFKWAG